MKIIEIIILVGDVVIGLVDCEGREEVVQVLVQ